MRLFCEGEVLLVSLFGYLTKDTIEVDDNEEV